MTAANGAKSRNFVDAARDALDRDQLNVVANQSFDVAKQKDKSNDYNI